MILYAFRDKLIRLAKDEDGVALVVTLAVFFFIYLICMGVYAVGTNVRERIHLQNACDAAAYSAAVVQADTLSRIATINRAMSWTYVQLTRRQMDYITYRWTEHAAKHWRDDKRAADNYVWANTISACPDLGHKHDVAFSDISLFGAKHISSTSVDGIDSALASERTRILTDQSFFGSGLGTGIGRLESQIVVDQLTIQKMGEAIDDLQNDFGAHVDDAIDEILKANIPLESERGRYIYLRKWSSPSSYMEEMQNGYLDENRFLGYVNSVNGETDSDNANKLFGSSGNDENGGNGWFRKRPVSGGTGFRRGYAGDADKLKATWTWHATAWHCWEDEAGIHHVPTPYTLCVHPSHGLCQCHSILFSPSRVAMRSDSLADNDSLLPRYSQYYETPEAYRARPRILTSAYFGGAGTISVGLAKKDENPFSQIFGKIASLGMFAAFNPFSEWQVALSSAKAGYVHNPDNDDGRDYWVSWKKHWKRDNGDKYTLNLSVSNWDAVHVPVRMATAMADGRDWPTPGTGKKKPQWHAEQISGHIEEWMSGEWKNLSTGAVSDESPQFAYAGGTVDQKADFDQLESESGQQWYAWGKMPTHLTNEGDGPVRVKWQIGNPGKNVNWDSLTERIFH